MEDSNATSSDDTKMTGRNEAEPSPIELERHDTADFEVKEENETSQPDGAGEGARMISAADAEEAQALEMAVTAANALEDDSLQERLESGMRELRTTPAKNDEHGVNTLPQDLDSGDLSVVEKLNKIAAITSLNLERVTLGLQEVRAMKEKIKISARLTRPLKTMPSLDQAARDCLFRASQFSHMVDVLDTRKRLMPGTATPSEALGLLRSFANNDTFTDWMASDAEARNQLQEALQKGYLVLESALLLRSELENLLSLAGDIEEYNRYLIITSGMA
ncbi:hypothetical protein H2200_005845 [Cladophialophora chaetospira]|uniref:Uncharacterized protein n=1 Tax=Cladophialophora chaetospira TaxID=386627 RepID=A0AA38X9X5_9EURO|nr:hypothetical protein H2200_005845 [Cladophialophora chaetospira]